MSIGLIIIEDFSHTVKEFFRFFTHIQTFGNIFVVCLFFLQSVGINSRPYMRLPGKGQFIGGVARQSPQRTMADCKYCSLPLHLFRQCPDGALQLRIILGFQNACADGSGRLGIHRRYHIRQNTHTLQVLPLRRIVFAYR